MPNATAVYFYNCCQIRKYELQCRSVLAYLLHWLPVHTRIMYKMLVLVYKTLYNNSAPLYMSNMLTIIPTSEESEIKRINLTPQQATVCTIHRRTVITFAGPNLWNESLDLCNLGLSRES